MLDEAPSGCFIENGEAHLGLVEETAEALRRFGGVANSRRQTFADLRP